MNQALSENENNIKSNLKEVLKFLGDGIEDEEDLDVNNIDEDLSTEDSEK